MDLMTATTSYQRLDQKYKGFTAPTIHITVDGTEITEKLGTRVANLSLDLSCGFKASGCTFDVLDEYLPANTAFNPKGAHKLLQLGARVEVALGYIVTERVFVGLVGELEYILDEDGLYFRVNCVDAKFLLMKQRRLEVRTGMSVTQAINQLLGEQPCSSYLTGTAVDNVEKKEQELSLAAKDDYTLAVQHAQRLGYEFFILCGKAYFRKSPASSSAIMDLSPGRGLLESRFSLRGSALRKRVEVLGMDPQSGKAVKGVAEIQGTFSKGSTASRMLGNTTQALLDRGVEDATQAKSRARQLVSRMQGEFGRLWARCVGIPELVPGRSVRVSGLMPEADTSFYILEVRHQLDESGFFTTFEAKVESL